MNYSRFRATPQEMLAPGRRVPRVLCVELTTRCNGRCVYCARAREQPEPIDMEIGTFRRIVDAVPGRQVVWPVSFGESLLHPDIVDAIAHVRDQGKSPRLITNGSLLDRTMGRALLRAGLDALRVSIDAADAETYNRTRPGLDWETLVENVRAFVRNRNDLGSECKLVIRATLARENEGQRKAIVRFWGALGCTVIVKPAVYVPSRRATGQVLAGTPRPCRWPINTLTIKAAGDVVLCCKDWWGNYSMGNLREREPLEIFNGSTFARTRHALGTGRLYPEICARCTESLE